jgi:hypothetical protein
VLAERKGDVSIRMRAMGDEVIPVIDMLKMNQSLTQVSFLNISNMNPSMMDQELMDNLSDFGK